MRSLDLKLKKFLVLLVKLLVTGLCFAYITHHLASNNPEILLDRLLGLEFPGWLLLSIVVLLVPLNWGLESMRWKRINGSLITTDESRSAVLMGISLGFIVPARIGEVLGRGVNRNKSEGVLVATNALYSGASQFMVTITLGLIGLIVAWNSELLAPWGWVTTEVVLGLSGATLMGWAMLFFGSKWIKSILKYLVPDRFSEMNGKNSIPNRQTIGEISLLGLFRYLVFGVQFAILLHMFGFNEGIMEMGVLITLYYLFTTLVPTSLLGKLGIRESVALFVFSGFLPDAFHILGCTLLLWLLNLALPALIGSFLILRQRLTLLSV